MTVVDYAASVSIDPGIAGGNELGALNSLAAGLSLLYVTIRHHELELLPTGDREMFAFGNIPGLSQDTIALLPCLFHWFGVSVCNYARLVGLLSGLSRGVFTRAALQDEGQFERITRHCDDYVTSLPDLVPVKQWRDKVAAHFAITAPRAKRDNIAALEFSVVYPVAYLEERFRVNAWSMIRTDANAVEHRTSMPRWSATEVFESLAPRFWPSAHLIPTPHR